MTPENQSALPKKATVFNLFEFAVSFTLFLAGWVVLLVWPQSNVGLGILITSLWVLTLMTTYRKASYQLGFLNEIGPILRQLALKLRVIN